MFGFIVTKTSYSVYLYNANFFNIDQPAGNAALHNLLSKQSYVKWDFTIKLHDNFFSKKYAFTQ